MKKQLLVALALTLTLVMSLSSCGLSNLFGGFFAQPEETTTQNTTPGTPDNKPQKITLTDAALNAQKVIDFANGADSSVLFESDGWTNGDVFNVVWKSSNVFYENGIMRLGITEEKASAWLNDKEVEFNYTAGEARTQNYYHYGDYEVSMKPSANAGTASTFFVCTGPYDTKFVLDENGDYVLDDNGQRVTVANAHDEIDIEFLGKDTTHVQFNFFVDGKGGNEYMYDLGFDASKEFHTYGFRWAEDSITWFVDGKPVYKVTTDKTATTGENVRIVEKLPSTAGRMLSNYWCGNERAWAWMGEYKGATNDNGTQYQWIATSAEGAPLNPPEKPPVSNDDINWADSALVAPTFPSAEKYVVTTEGNKATITYENIGGSDYKPVEMDITEAAAGKNYVYLKITNNGTELVNVRVNVIDQALVDAGAQNMATNVSATMNGVVVNTDLVWGGSFFDIAAGETAELVVKFNGVVEKLQLMIDSSRNDATLRSGNVTVEEIKFATFGEIVTPPENEDPITPPPATENPTSGDLSTTVNGSEITFQGNVTDGYGVNANDENNTVNVVYTNVVGNSYKNFWAPVSSIASTKNAFTVTVTNNGTEAIKFRIDIESATQINANTTACNLSSTQDGNSAFTDLEWGGSTFVIEAGATSVLVVNYDASKTPTNLKIFVDSCQWDDGTAHAGDVTLSNMEFIGEYIPEETEPEETAPVTPEETTPETTEPEVTPDAGLQFNFWTSSPDYTANGNNIQYNGAGNSYSCAGTDIAALAAGNNTFVVTITNNGTADSRVRVDIQATTQIGNHTVCNVSAVGGDVWTDFEWGGSTVTVPAGQSVTLTITYDENTERGAVTNLVVFVDSGRGTADTYNSNVTLSGMAFSKVGGEEPEETTPEETTPVVPMPEIPTDGEYVKFEGNLDVYNIVSEREYANVIHVNYSEVSTNTYKNLNTWIKEKADGKNLFSISLRNNGITTAYVTVKLETVDAVQIIEKKMVIGPGVLETLTTEFSGEAAFLYLFIDSGWSETTTTTYMGDIIIAGIKFSASETPAVPALPTDGEYVKFGGNLDVYSVITESEYANVIQVTYTAVDTNTWQNVNTWIADKAEGKTNLSVTLRNNGTETAYITVKLENSEAGSAKDTKVELAAGEVKTVTLDYTNEAVMLFFFIDSDWSEVTTTHSGDITIAGIKFQ